MLLDRPGKTPEHRWTPHQRPAGLPTNPQLSRHRRVAGFHSRPIRWRAAILAWRAPTPHILVPKDAVPCFLLAEHLAHPVGPIRVTRWLPAEDWMSLQGGRVVSRMSRR